MVASCVFLFFLKEEAGMRVLLVTGFQTCALPLPRRSNRHWPRPLLRGEASRGLRASAKLLILLVAASGIGLATCDGVWLEPRAGAWRSLTTTSALALRSAVRSGPPAAKSSARRCAAPTRSR